MSRSVSGPSSVTNTSPCWNGLIVPGSTLMYGSNFWTCTLRPRDLSSRPSDAAVMPLPSDETTPPVTKTNFATYIPLPAARLTGFHVTSGSGRRHGLHEVEEAFHRTLRVSSADGDRHDRVLVPRAQRDVHVGRRLEQVPRPALVLVDLADQEHRLDAPPPGQPVVLRRVHLPARAGGEAAAVGLDARDA